MPELADGLTFILPVRDQESALSRVVASWLPVLDGLKQAYELLIVDDGSKDGTSAQASKLAERNPRIRVLMHAEPLGFGASLKTALAEGKYSTVFYCSADHAWNPQDLPRMLKSLELRDEFTNKAVEVVNGHRRGTVLSPGKRWRNRIYRWLVRIVYGYWPDPPRGYLGKSENRFWWRCRVLFGLRIGDPGSKFKLFRRSILDRIEIQSRGDFVNSELLAKANFLGCLMDEMGLSDRDVPPPASNMSKDMWEVFNDARFRTLQPTSASVATTESQPVPA